VRALARALDLDPHHAAARHNAASVLAAKGSAAAQRVSAAK
jgi:hypothetical protein